MSFYSPYRWCVALNCKNSTLKTPEKLFITVPKDVSMRYVWLELAGRDPTKYSDKSHLYLCEDHFDVSTYIIKLFIMNFTSIDQSYHNIIKPVFEYFRLFLLHS